jgi:hypothetical protein
MAIVAFFLAAPAMAQTYDIADYMMLTPGQWSIKQGEIVCGGLTDPEAVVCSTQGKYTLHSWYEQEGGVWQKDSIDILEITADSVIYRGEYEFEAGEEGYWLLNPPITLSRNLELNQPVVNKGVITHNGESLPYVHSFMLLEAGVTVTTPDGVFNNCLKIVKSDIETGEGGGGSEVMIWAPGWGEVKIWAAEVESTGSEGYLESVIDQIISHGSF